MTIFAEHVERWRRQAEEYRTLASCAKTESARGAYTALAADCETLAERFAETLSTAERDGTPIR